MGSRSYPFSQDAADIVLERIAQGGARSALANVLQDDENLPGLTTWFKWLRERPSLAVDYTRACEARSEIKAAEIEEIADTPQLGEKITVKGDGSVEVVTGDMIEHRKLRIETRKWANSHLNPKKYTPKTAIEHSGTLEILDADSEALMQELMDMLATGRLKLPNGVELMMDDGDYAEDEADYNDLADDEPYCDLD